MRERRHEGVHAGILAVLVDDASTHIRPRLGVEHGYEMILLVNNLLIHAFSPRCCPFLYQTLTILPLVQILKEVLLLF
jgi:hypothetical protein